MIPKILKPKEKRFFSKTFDQLSQVKKIIRLIQEDIVLEVQLSLLVKLEKSYRTDTQDLAERIELLSADWQTLLGIKTNFGVFDNQEIGPIFVIGPLTELFLYDVDGKKLAELSEGPYGILRGLGIDGVVAAEQVRKLNEGNYLLLAKGNRFEIDSLEGILRALDKVG